MNYATLLLGMIAITANAETMDDYLQRKQAKLEAGVLYHMFEDSDDAEGFVIVRAK
jgi:hypothetical protein